MSTENKYWFPAKSKGYGWGWGLPIAWQGWVVFASFLLLVIAGSIVFAPVGALSYCLYVCALGLLLVLICWMTGEPLNGS